MPNYTVGTQVIGNKLVGNDVGVLISNLDGTCNATMVPTNVKVVDNDIRNDAVTNTTGNGAGPYQAGVSDQGNGDQITSNTICGAGYDPANQPAGGYVNYDERTNTFSLSPEQVLTLATEDSPAYLPGAFQLALGSLKAVPRITEAFRNGAGMGWHEHDGAVFCGTEKFFRPNYAANLISAWIPALSGVKEKLESGALVADVGCGHGASTILMANAYPKSLFVGFDYHGGSIDAARKAAERAGVANCVRFEQAAAKNFTGKDYDLVAFFDKPTFARAGARQAFAARCC